ncbi:MAG TPA: Stp1/IreP family PP2C-type Ser/Thr phosphatase [Actinomycetota bacterium]|nr:Stp1/IreP family PP2C-type Ser/Thr phosphatase [Actinomycetota bacterium]
MNVTVGAQTDVGRVRQGNEDSYLLEPPIYAVADGMGGHIAGDVASATAVDVIAAGAREASSLDGNALAELVNRANEAIWEKARSDPSLRGMGTTCTLLMVDGATAYLAHVGDSRAYLLRDGSLTQLTEDHTLVERMVREGRLSAEEAAIHPQRSVITRALGVDQNVQVDVLREQLTRGDRILLASDGLTSMVGAGDIADVLTSEEDPQAAADRLVEIANAAGGEDNVTVLVVDVGKDGAPAPPPAAPARHDTRPGAEPQAERPPRRWVRPLVWTVAVVAVIGIAAFAAAQWALSNSWYVGLSEDGVVTIYQGIPEEIAGRTFADVERETDITADDVPETFVEDLEEGVKVDSLDDAELYVGNIQDRIDEIEEATEQRRDDRRRDRS